MVQAWTSDILASIKEYQEYENETNKNTQREEECSLF